MRRIYDIINSYTLETSIYGSDKFGHFTMDDLQDIGVDFALALVDFTSIENCVSCLDVLRSTSDLTADGSRVRASVVDSNVFVDPIVAHNEAYVRLEAMQKSREGASAVPLDTSVEDIEKLAMPASTEGTLVGTAAASTSSNSNNNANAESSQGSSTTNNSASASRLQQILASTAMTAAGVFQQPQSQSPSASTVSGGGNAAAAEMASSENDSSSTSQDAPPRSNGDDVDEETGEFEEEEDRLMQPLTEDEDAEQVAEDSMMERFAAEEDVAPGDVARVEDEEALEVAEELKGFVHLCLLSCQCC